MEAVQAILSKKRFHFSCRSFTILHGQKKKERNYTYTGDFLGCLAGQGDPSTLPPKTLPRDFDPRSFGALSHYDAVVGEAQGLQAHNACLKLQVLQIFPPNSFTPGWISVKILSIHTFRV